MSTVQPLDYDDIARRILEKQETITCLHDQVASFVGNDSLERIKRILLQTLGAREQERRQALLDTSHAHEIALAKIADVIEQSKARVSRLRYQEKCLDVRIVKLTEQRKRLLKRADMLYGTVQALEKDRKQVLARIVDPCWEVSVVRHLWFNG